jgi:hypothetical protein
MAAGTAITLTVRDSPPGVRRVIGASDDDLMVLNLSHPALTSAAKAALLDMAARGRNEFLSLQYGGVFVSASGLRVGPDGIFIAGAKAAELADVVETIDRDDVRLITTSRRSRGSKAGAAIGGLAGAVAGLYAASQLVFKQCGDRCADEKLGIGLALVGLPAAGAIVGYKAMGRNVTNVIYRAAGQSPAT